MDPAADAMLVAAAVPAPELGSVLSLWEGDARLEPACDAPPRRASRGRLAGVRGPGNLHSHGFANISGIYMLLSNFILQADSGEILFE